MGLMRKLRMLGRRGWFNRQGGRRGLVRYMRLGNSKGRWRKTLGKIREIVIGDRMG